MPSIVLNFGDYVPLEKVAVGQFCKIALQIFACRPPLTPCKPASYRVMILTYPVL